MNNCYLLVNHFYYDNLELYNKKRDSMGSKRGRKASKETKVHKEKTGAEHTFFTKVVITIEKHFGIFVCSCM